jgi:tRNA threonylcarbamoyladenosine biosynthesis protein TsaE
MIRTWDRIAPGQMGQLASELLEAISESGYVLLLKGDLGAGKTTLVREICRLLGVGDEVQSPTYAIVNEYSDRKGNPVYHMDLYRLKSEAEAYDVGIEQYLSSGYFCMVEWPDTFSALFPDKCPVVTLKHQGDTRKITLSYE